MTQASKTQIYQLSAHAEYQLLPRKGIVKHRPIIYDGLGGKFNEYNLSSEISVVEHRTIKYTKKSSVFSTYVMGEDKKYNPTTNNIW